MMRVFVDTNILIDYALGRERGDVIVTNNGRDFTAFSLLPVMTAAELLSSVSDIVQQHS